MNFFLAEFDKIKMKKERNFKKRNNGKIQYLYALKQIWNYFIYIS